jgi:FkbM family methyltransferase
MCIDINPASLLIKVYACARRARLFQSKSFSSFFISCYFLYKRLYEDPLQNLLDKRPAIVGNKDVLDVGANVGYTSFLLARVVKSTAKIYAFEPDQLNFTLLQQTIRRKALGNKIAPFNMVVGNFEGSVEFWHNDSHLGDHRVVTENLARSRSDMNMKRTRSVPITSIDAFVKSRNVHFSFVKIDVQGYELSVAEGMTESLVAFPDANICFEYAPQILVEMGCEPVKLLEFFRTRGYLLYIITRSAMELVEEYGAIHRYTDANGYVDLLCSRKSLA